MGYIRPDADDTVSNFETNTGSGTNLYQTIDETPYDDADYIQNIAYPSTTAVYRCTISDPGWTIGPGLQFCRVRYQVTGWVNDTVDINFTVYEGVVAKGTLGRTQANMATTWTSSVFTITGISDYTDLLFSATINAQGDGGVGVGEDTNLQLQISQVEVWIPEPGTCNPFDGAYGGPFRSAVR